MFRCQFFLKGCQSASGVKQHQTQRKECRAKLELFLEQFAINARDELLGNETHAHYNNGDDNGDGEANTDASLGFHDLRFDKVAVTPDDAQPRIHESTHVFTGLDQRASVEDVEDEGEDAPETGHFVEAFQKRHTPGCQPPKTRSRQTLRGCERSGEQWWMGTILRENGTLTRIRMSGT